MERIHVRPDDLAPGLCALIATVPTVAAVATLATTVGELLGPRATPAIPQAVRDRYQALTHAGCPDGPAGVGSDGGWSHLLATYGAPLSIVSPARALSGSVGNASICVAMGSPKARSRSSRSVWHHPGAPVVPLRWVLIRDPQAAFPTQALLCTDLDAAPAQIIAWFVQRWQMESTFHAAREHLGLETGRGWAERTIRRTTPILLGLFSPVTLLAHDYLHDVPQTLTIRRAAWYHKRCPTFSDTLALVRRYLWTQVTFATSPADTELTKVSPALVDHLCDLLCYAA